MNTKIGEKMSIYKFLASDSASAMEEVVKNLVRCVIPLQKRK